MRSGVRHCFLAVFAVVVSVEWGLAQASESDGIRFLRIRVTGDDIELIESTSRPGRLKRPYGGSGGTFSISTMHEDAAELLMHEMGHSFAGLADEYESRDGLPREAPNTTATTEREFIRWSAWIDDDVPVPTPVIGTYASRVGLFEGASYRSTGWFRPKLTCRMRELHRPFCEVCREQHVSVFHRLANSVRQFHPDTTGVISIRDERVYLSASVDDPALGPLKTGWFVNGSPLEPADGSSFEVSAHTVGPGRHKIAFRVADESPAVRSPYQLIALRETIVWHVDVSGIVPGPDLVTLLDAYPNPVSDQTVIRFHLAEGGSVRLRIFDTLGREVARPIDGELTSGSHYVEWRPSEDVTTAGLYLYSLSVDAANYNGSILVVR